MTKRWIITRSPCHIESSKIARVKANPEQPGQCFSDWGQYDKAVEYYEKSLAICRELKDRRGEGKPWATWACL